MRLCWLTLSVLLVTVIGAAVVYARLSSGPLHLTGLAKPLAEYLSEDSDTFRLSIGDVIVSLGEKGAASGIQFRDVTAYTPEGALLMSVPRVAAQFEAEDLLRGDVLPTRVVLVRPQARVVRQTDGRIRIGLGVGDGIVMETEAPEAGRVETEQFDAIARVMDGFVGDMDPIPELARLSEISILGIDFSYLDQITGGGWETNLANIRIRRNEDGATATLTARLDGGARADVPLTIVADRRAGTGQTEIDLQFSGVQPDLLKAQVPDVDWSQLADGTLSGSFITVMDRNGVLGDVSGILRADDGLVRLSGIAARRFERLDLAFTYDHLVERLDIETMAIRGPTTVARISGFVDVVRDEGGKVANLDTQIEVHEMRVFIPEIFAETLEFDDGLITGRVALDPETGNPATVSVRDAYLSEGDLIIGLNGEVRPSGDALLTDLRASAINMTVDQLMAHWPLAAAVNARDWIDDNIQQGLINTVVAHLRVAEGEPQLSLDFTYSNLRSTYLDPMSPIREARGRGHLTFHDFFLFLEDGVVEPVEGQPVRLGPSRLVFRDLWGVVTPAEIAISGEGGVGPILALIDEEPLGLVSKLGLDTAAIKGDAQVNAALTFPLLNDLLLDQVTVDVSSTIRDVSMPFALPGRSVKVGAQQIKLDATTSAMTISGEVAVDGTPLRLAWRENYGAGPDHRKIEARGVVTPDLLTRFDAAIPGFDEGSINAAITVGQAGNSIKALDLKADLEDAALRIEGLDWRKRPGTAGSLDLRGSVGERVTIDQFDLRAAGLSARGSVALDASGALREARIARLRLDDRIDMRVEVSPAGRGMALELSGAKLDITAFDLAGEQEETTENPAPLDVGFDLDLLTVSEGIDLADAKGRFSRGVEGASAQITARVGAGAAVEAGYRAPADGADILTLTTNDAGALLQHLDVYDGGREGELTLRAELDPEPGVDLAGLLKIRNLRLQDEEEVVSVLRAGKIDEEQVEQVSSGLVFRSIRAPFSYIDGRILLGKSWAKSPSLAVTASGEVDREADKIDLVGAISPAYGLTGALDEVPLLGAIFSGGEGEGIFAMTFSMQGSLADPQISVNPLSLLTPGFLRKIFSGRRGAPDDDFVEQLDRNDR
ncbi:MAG: AsmA-like C-terminal region-containing protein [Pseudomonadota bacterium]